jgi:DNA-binding LytR/AlgR family response regulator
MRIAWTGVNPASTSSSISRRSPMPGITPPFPLLELAQVEWFESAGNCVRVCSAGRAYLLRATMDKMAQRPGAHTGFIRVRRSAIVNVRAVTTLERYGKGAYVVRLRNGTEIISSRFYQPGLRRPLHSE